MREELPNERREMASKRNKNREELPNERREMTSKQNKDREELLEERREMSKRVRITPYKKSWYLFSPYFLLKMLTIYLSYIYFILIIKKRVKKFDQYETINALKKLLKYMHFFQ